MTLTLCRFPLFEELFSPLIDFPRRPHSTSQTPSRKTDVSVVSDVYIDGVDMPLIFRQYMPLAHDVNLL